MRSRANNRGFTIIELLLVLALIVIIAAMVAPAFHGPIEDFRLLKSADLVRARWAKARNEAMRSGQTTMFRYQAQTGLFEIGPWQSDVDYLESSQLFSTTISSVNQPVAAPSQEELPENVTFAALTTVANTRDVQIQQFMQSQGGVQALWSPPILFYPDGTSSTTRVTLANSRQQFVVIQLRGLSGVAEVSGLLNIMELPP